MNRWALPLIVIIALIFCGALYFTQGKRQAEPNLPPEADQFKPISLDKNGEQTQQSQQQTQQQAPQVQGQTLGGTTQGQTQQQQQQQTQQQPQQQTQQQQTLKDSYNAVIKTSKGNISVVLRSDKAPHTVINFINKAETDYYKNLIFHRVEDWVVQGGDPQGNGTGGGNIAVEFNDLPFTAGALGAASRGDGQVQNDSQFFITKSDATWLNGQYTNFGQVTDGMDVVNSMQIGDKILGIQVEGIN